MLHSLGLFAHARRRSVIAIWFAVLLALGVSVGSFGSSFSTQFNLPDVESADGFTLLSERFGAEESGRSGTIVVRADGGFTAVQRDALNAFFSQLDARDDMGVVSPFTPAGARQVAPSGDIAFATVSLASDLDTAEQFA
ncbi:MAG: hypothetical protein RIR87_1311, partial [Actinomycetota bacterium]